MPASCAERPPPVSSSVNMTSNGASSMLASETIAVYGKEASIVREMMRNHQKKTVKGKKTRKKIVGNWKRIKPNRRSGDGKHS
jgi:hypothetical protein